jgi:hypothetical protein
VGHEPTIIREPQVYIVGRQTLDCDAVDRFWRTGADVETDTEVGGEQLVEAGGASATCRSARGARPTEYITNLSQ